MDEDKNGEVKGSELTEMADSVATKIVAEIPDPPSDNVDAVSQTPPDVLPMNLWQHIAAAAALAVEASFNSEQTDSEPSPTLQSDLENLESSESESNDKMIQDVETSPTKESAKAPVASGSATVDAAAKSKEKNIHKLIQYKRARMSTNTCSSRKIGFHNVCGKNVILDTAKEAAKRCNGDVGQCYIFTNRIVPLGEIVKIKVDEIDEHSLGSLSFGVTSCNPIKLSQLPDDVEEFMKRSEYWFYVTDICNSVKENDVMTFVMTASGEVSFRINGMKHGYDFDGNQIIHTNESFFMFINPAIPLYLFWDVSGRVKGISLVIDKSATPKSASHPSSQFMNTPLASIKWGSPVPLSTVAGSIKSLASPFVMPPPSAITAALPSAVFQSSTSMTQHTEHAASGATITCVASGHNIQQPQTSNQNSFEAFFSHQGEQNMPMDYLHLITNQNPNSGDSAIQPIQSSQISSQQAQKGSVKPQASSQGQPLVSPYINKKKPSVIVMKSVIGDPSNNMIMEYPMGGYVKNAMTDDEAMLDYLMNDYISEGYQPPKPKSSSNTNDSAASGQTPAVDDGVKKIHDEVKEMAQKYLQEAKLNLGRNKPRRMKPKPEENSHSSNATQSFNDGSLGESSMEMETSSEATVSQITSNSKMCIMCSVKESNSIFYRCGHKCMCFDCGKQHWLKKSNSLWGGNKGGLCPVCRGRVTDVVKIIEASL